MAYTIQAVVARRGVFPAELPTDLLLVDLNHTLQMIPLGTTALTQHDLPFLPLTDDGDVEFPSPLRQLCVQLSVNGDVAYIEAEIFGGAGRQAHVLIGADGRVGSPFVGHDAINIALRWLGVKISSGNDEFQSLGLDKYRQTDKWIDQV